MEMASVNLNSGPPCSAMNCWPSSSKVPVTTVSLPPGPASSRRCRRRILEFLKEDENVEVHRLLGVVVEAEKGSNFWHGGSPPGFGAVKIAACQEREETP